MLQNDPIVDEVRRSRLEIEKECRGDFGQIYARALEVQKKVIGKVVSRANRIGITMRKTDEETSTYPQEKQL